METKINGESRYFSSNALISYFSLATLLLHLLSNHNYGFFRDELYYIACGEHLDWGYIDQPPLIAIIAKVMHSLSGSLTIFRLPAALAGALKVALTGLMVRELGGRRYAQAIAMLAVIIVPVYLYLNTILTMNAFEPLCWMGCAYLVILILKGRDARLWLLFGILAGIGLENKHSMLFFGFGLFIGLLLTPARKQFLSGWIWLGGLIALLFFLPNLLWEIKYDWITVKALDEARRSTNYPLSPFQFFTQQIMLMHPLTFPLWMAGLYYYLISPIGKQFRLLGWTYLVMLALFIILKGKTYYLAPAYPMLFAGGAIIFERLLGNPQYPRLKILRIGFGILLLIGGAILAPLSLPILPVETFIRYKQALNMEELKIEKKKMGKLPQGYADMFGWPELAATVSQVYHSLTPAEQQKCAIFTDNYGEAGAIDLFGSNYGLPKAISGHQNYFLWGPRDYTGEIVITVGIELTDLQQAFNRVEPGAIFSSEYIMPYEDQLPIYICREPRNSLKAIWPHTEHH